MSMRVEKKESKAHFPLDIPRCRRQNGWVGGDGGGYIRD